MAGRDDSHSVASEITEKRAAAALLTSFDFSEIEEMDPSLEGGFQIIYDRECPVEMRLQEGDEVPQQVGTLESVKAKILVLGPDSDPKQVRLELRSESDLFFHYTHSMDEATFRAVQEEQKLMMEFPEYANVLARMLNSVIKQTDTHLAMFVMHKDGRARLDFIQNVEFKFIELLSCDFERTNDELIRRQITYRYNAMKSRLAIMQARMQDVQNLVKIKNPSLLLQLQRGTGVPTGSPGMPSATNQSQHSARGGGR